MYFLEWYKRYLILLAMLTITLGCSKNNDYEKGAQEQKDKHYEAAVKLYDSAIKNDPKFIDAYSGRSYCYYALGNYDRSIEDLYKVIPLAKKPYKFYCVMGRMKLKIGDYKGALSDFKTSCGGSDEDLTDGDMEACNMYLSMKSGTNFQDLVARAFPQEPSFTAHEEQGGEPVKLPGNDRTEAKLYKGALAGDKTALLQLAVLYCKSNRMEKGQDIFKILANTGDAGAQYNLGKSYYVTGHVSEAIKWWKISSIKRPEAAFNLGLLYYNGDNVEMNKEEAFKWYKKAADKKFGQAQFNVGLMYYKGEGVSRDLNEAVKWLQYAAASNDTGASERAKNKLQEMGVN